MGMLDRTLSTFRPMNSIEQAPARAPEHVPLVQGADLPPPAPAPAGGRSTPAAPKPAAFATEPEAIARSYFVEERGGERRYYDDYRRQALAMRATATAIRTRREDLTTIRAMLTLAQARGWQALEVKGSQAFKREAWIEAQALGLEARGYPASDPDRQEALRRRAEQGLAHQAPTNRIEASAPEAPAPADKKERAPAKIEPYPIGLSSDPRIRRAQSTLSPDARLVLAALESKIERQMRQQNARATAELKAFVGTELLKKERAHGPVELAPAQRRAVTTPPREVAREAVGPASARRLEPEEPRRTRGR
jgi:hypothetical protein